MPVNRPNTDIDLFSHEAIIDPYANYKTIRDAGTAVWMNKYDMWAVGRYDEVRKVLRDHATFTSTAGVSMDPGFNKISAQAQHSLVTDPPLHDQIRKVTSRPLMPRALKEIEPRITAAAEKLIDDLVVRDTFEGMTELAQYLPLTIVSELVGIPEYGRDSMLSWAAATFNVQGPMNELGKAGMEHIKGFHEFCRSEAVPGNLTLGGWAIQIYEAADRGEIPHEFCSHMMREYLVPSLDTTIAATGHLMRLLGENPDQWALLKSDPTPKMINGAINEALRVFSPIRSFTRLAVTDTKIGDIDVKKGDRIAILYACANRDERHWEYPDSYRITRDAQSQLSFGHGIHTCMGMHLAELEMAALLTAMIARVDTIRVGTPEIVLNNTLTAYSKLPMQFTRMHAPKASVSA